MITKHIINKENDEEVLYLYFDFNIEIGEIGKMNEKKGIFKQIKDYILNKKINFNGRKIVLVVMGMIVSVILTTGVDNKINNVNSNEYDYVNRVILYDYDDDLKLIDNYEIVVNENEIENNKIITNETTVNEKVNETIVNQITSTSDTVANQKETKKNINSSLPIQKPNENVGGTNVEKSQPKTDTVTSGKTITIYRSNGTIVEMDIEEYLIGVVGAEMPASFHIEALKAQAVVSRTYAAYQLKSGKILTDTVKTQVYKDKEQLKQQWGADFDKYYNKVKEAVESTKGLYITYNGEYINAVYFSTSNGYTEDATNVWNDFYPYLVSVESPWDRNASSYLRIVEKTYNELSKILGIDVNTDTLISIISRNDSGRVDEIEIANKKYTGVELRNLLGLRSADFDIEKTETGIKFTTRGYGHGVGFSQYGANGMANSGYKFREIISHYYPNTQIKTF